jgi:hypothetical protein
MEMATIIRSPNHAPRSLERIVEGNPQQDADRGGRLLRGVS